MLSLVPSVVAIIAGAHILSIMHTLDNEELFNLTNTEVSMVTINTAGQLYTISSHTYLEYILHCIMDPLVGLTLILHYLYYMYESITTLSKKYLGVYDNVHGCTLQLQ